MKSNLDSIDVAGVQRCVPLLWKIHRWSVGFLVLNETDANDDLVFVSQEESNRLKPTRVSGPPSRTRDASGEAFVAISMRHTPCKLQLWVQFPTFLHLDRRKSGVAAIPRCGRGS